MRSDYSLGNLETIAARWQQYGPARAKYPSLWDSSLALATLGPQTDREWKTPAGALGAKDYSGRNNHGTLTNGPTWQQAVHRGGGFQGLSLGGVDGQGITVGSSSLAGFSGFAVTGWVRPAASQTRGIYSEDIAAGTVLATYQNASDYVGYVMQSDGTSLYATASGLATVGELVHLAFVGSVGSSAVYLYVNGKVRGTAAWNGTRRTPIVWTGIGDFSNPGNFSWNGLLADMRVYSRSLTPAEIATLATHPNAAYQVRDIPRVFAYSGTAAHRWPWQIRRSRRVAGAR